MTDSFAPTARTAGLLESLVEDELVLYDVERDRVHALNPTALALWRACDGEADVAKLSQRLAVDPDVVWYGLRELDRRGLLGPGMPSGADDRRIARRALLKKLAVGGTVGLAAPTILSVVAADPAAAVTCRTSGQSCTGGFFACGLAVQGTCCTGLRCCQAPLRCQ
ncbi:MAG: PqqD family protein [Acidimicrobiales bacterium]